MKATTEQQGMPLHIGNDNAFSSKAVIRQQDFESDQQQRKIQKRGDGYHVKACRCDLTNTCLSELSQPPMTFQTELFLCLKAESNRVDIIGVDNLVLRGKEMEFTPIQDGRAMDSKTWITRHGRDCTIRTRLDSKFFENLMPSHKHLRVVAQGDVVLQRIHSNNKQKPKNSKKDKTKQKPDKPNSLRFLANNTSNGHHNKVVNVTAPFQVDVMVDASDSQVVDAVVNYSWLILLGVGLVLCCLSIGCRLCLERRLVRRARRRIQKNGAPPSDDDTDSYFERKDDNEEFMDEMSLVSKTDAHVVRV